MKIMIPTKKTIILLLTLFAALWTGGTSAFAQSIGVQFVGAGTALATTDSAGVVAQTNWKAATGSSFSSLALNNNSGAATTATLSGSAAGTYFGGSTLTGGNQKLASGELFNNDINTVTTTLSVASIPYGTYDVYIYGACDAAGRNATFTVTPSGGAASSKSFQTQSAASSWTEGTNTWNGSGTAPTLSPANYVRFTGLTATSFTLKFGGVGNVGLNGIQIVSVAGGSAPAAPTGLGATAASAQVSLSWTGSSGATSYNVYRGTSAGGESTTPIVTGLTGTTYVNTGLTNGTAYYYKVKAVNSFGTSAYSNEANATPTAGGSAPAAPTGLGAASGNAQTSLSWTASSGATSYNVYRGTSAGGESTTPIVTGLTGTTYTNTGLTNGTAYYYKVAAVNSFGTSGYSNEASATPAAGGGSALTGTIIGTSGSYGGSSSTVDKVFDGNLTTYFDANVGSGAWAGLDLGTAKVITQLAYAPRTGWASRMTGGVFQGGNASDFSDAVTLFTVSGTPTEGSLTTQTVSNGTAFRYVRYLSPANGWGNIAEVVFYGSGGGGSAPAAPAGLSATAGNSQVSLAWTASSGATSYNVYRGTSAGGESTTPIVTGLTGVTYVNTGLTNGTAYYYKVKAVNSFGTSGYSNEASATPVSGSSGDIDLTGYTLRFADEFNSFSGTLTNPKGAATWYAQPLNSFGYFSASTWDIATFSATGGVLSSKATLDASSNWHSGILYSVDPGANGFSQQYGYFEMRCRMPNSGSGAWPAFWLETLSSIPGNSNLEIDILEWYGVCNTPGSYQAVMQQATHNWKQDGSQDQVAPYLYSPGTPMPGGAYPWQDYHIYGLKIDTAHITWYIDGVQTNQIATPTAYMSGPFYMIIDYALGGGWPLSGMVNNSSFDIDWVRVYSLPGQ